MTLRPKGLLNVDTLTRYLKLEQAGQIDRWQALRLKRHRAIAHLADVPPADRNIHHNLKRRN